MAKHEKERKKVAAARDTGQDNLLLKAMGGKLTKILNNTLTPVVNEMKASNQALRDDLAEVNGRLRLVEVHAAAQDDDEEDGIVLTAAKEDDESDDMNADEDESDDMAAAKNDDSDESDESDDMAAARGRKAGGGGMQDDDDDSDSDDSSDDASLDAMEDLSLEDASQEPGEVNKDASNRGRKTTVTKPPKQGEHFSGNVAKGRIKGKGGNNFGKGKGFGKPFPKGMEAAAVKIETLYASNKKLVKTVKTLQAQAEKRERKYATKLSRMNAQLEHFAEQEGRRSVMPTELTALAAKSGINLPEIKANGQQLSVDAVDTMFANARQLGINIEPKDRIAMKNLLIEQGLMDEGRVNRGY
jgi:hypothetical protein